MLIQYKMKLQAGYKQTPAHFFFWGVGVGVWVCVCVCVWGGEAVSLSSWQPK